MRKFQKQSNELLHYGIIGQKWYHRRYQYPDGSLTPDGRKRYAEAYKRYNVIRVRNMVGSFVQKQYSMDPKCNSALKAWREAKRQYDIANYERTLSPYDLDKLYYEKERLYEQYSKEKRRVYNTQIKDSYEYKLLNNQYSAYELYDEHKDKKISDIRPSADISTAKELLSEYEDILPFKDFVKYRHRKEGDTYEQ